MGFFTGLFALDNVLRVRDQLPRFDYYRPATPVGRMNTVVRVLAAVLGGLALLLLAIWVTVSLTIELL